MYQKKNYYLTIAIVSGAAFATTFFLLPSRENVALFYSYDKQYETSFVLYKELYEKGNRSQNVIMPLVTLLEKSGNIDEAILLMKQWAEKETQNPDPLSYLSKFYFDSGRYFEYLETLEKLQALDPTEEQARLIYTLHRRYGNRKKELEYLNTLADHFTPTEEEFLLLAQSFLEENEIQEIEETISQLLNAYPLKTLKLPTAEFLIRFYFSEGSSEKGETLFVEYFQAQHDDEIQATLFSILKEYKQYPLALELYTNLHPIEQVAPLNIEAFAGILETLNRKEELFQFFNRLHHEKTLPKYLFDHLFSLALEMNKLSFFAEADVYSELSPPFILQLITAAEKKHNITILNQLQKKASSGQFKNSPSVTIALMSFDDTLSTTEKHTLLHFYTKYRAPHDDLFPLSFMLAKKGFFIPARQLLSLIDEKVLSKYEAGEVYDLYDKLNLLQEGWALVKNQEQNALWILFATRLATNETLLDWIKKETDVSSHTLKWAAQNVLQYRDPAIAELFAEKLNQEAPSEASQALLAQVFLKKGELKIAFDLLKPLFPKEKESTIPYFKTLALLSSQEGTYKALLLDQIAKNRRHTKLLEEIGYALVEENAEKSAEPFFFAAAESLNFKASAVQMLLYLWGEKLSDRELAWVAQKSEDVEGEEKSLWLKHLLDLGYAKNITPLIRGEEWKEDSIGEIYIQALILQKEEEKLREVLAYVIPLETRIPRLKKYGSLAAGESLIPIARQLYTSVLNLKPDDEESLFALGKIAYYRGEYRLAKHYFLQLTDHPKATFLPFYYLGEIATVRQDLDCAHYFYNKAYAKEAPKDFEERILYANLLTKVNCDKEALSLYETLMKENTSSISARTSYAFTLIALDQFQSAHKLLFDDTYPIETKEELESIVFAKVQLLQNCEQFAAAEALLEKQEKSETATLAKAELAQARGRWTEAVSSIHKLSKKQPYNEVLKYRKREILEGHRGGGTLSRELIKTGDIEVKFIETCKLSGYVSPSCFYAWSLEQNTYSTDDYANIDDNSLSSKRVKRYRGEVEFCHINSRSSEWRGRVFFSPYSLGCGLNFLSVDDFGHTLWVVEYHKPNWDFAQTIIDDGTLDLLAVSRSLKLARRLELTLAAGLNQYNLAHTQTAARSYDLEVLLTYALSRNHPLIKPFRDRLTVTLNYGLDAEYVIYRKQRLSPSLSLFHPLPIDSREVHTFTGFANLQLQNNINLEGFAGYSYDREVKGKASALYGGAATFGKKECSQFQAAYSHSPSTENNGENSDRFQFLLNFCF